MPIDIRMNKLWYIHKIEVKVNDLNLHATICIALLNNID